MAEILCDKVLTGGLDEKATDDFVRLSDLKKRIESKTKIKNCFNEIIQNGAKTNLNTMYDTKNEKKYRVNVMEQNVLSLMSIEDSINDDKRELCELLGKLYKVIDKIDNMQYQELLIYRYICGDKWEVVAKKMDYSYVHVVHRLHPKALEKYLEVIAQ